jgi:hypothetical protein
MASRIAVAGGLLSLLSAADDSPQMGARFSCTVDLVDRLADCLMQSGNVIDLLPGMQQHTCRR